MKRAYLICLVQLLATTSLFCQSNSDSLLRLSGKVAPQVNASQADPKAQARTLEQYGKLPLSFEANQGQSDAQVKYLSRGQATACFSLPTKRYLLSGPTSLRPPIQDRLRAAVSQPLVIRHLRVRFCG
jgi:hypothetical protein